MYILQFSRDHKGRLLCFDEGPYLLGVEEAKKIISLLQEYVDTWTQKDLYIQQKLRFYLSGINETEIKTYDNDKFGYLYICLRPDGGFEIAHTTKKGNKEKKLEELQSKGYDVKIVWEVDQYKKVKYWLYKIHNQFIDLDFFISCIEKQLCFPEEIKKMII